MAFNSPLFKYDDRSFSEGLYSPSQEFDDEAIFSLESLGFYFSLVLELNSMHIVQRIVRVGKIIHKKLIK